MLSEQLAWCQGENFMYALRSMIIDRVDFPGLDFHTYEIFETIYTLQYTLLFVSLAGFVCGFSLLIPWVTGRLKRPTNKYFFFFF